MEVQKEVLSCSFSGGYHKVTKETLVVLVESWYLGIPMAPISLKWIIEIVEALSEVWELDFGDTLEAIAEREFVFVQGSSIGPHG